MAEQVVVQCLVVGITSTAEPDELEKILTPDVVDHSRLAVVTKDTPTEEHEESPLHFVHVHLGLPHETSDVDHEVLIGDTSIFTDAGGVNIPNISADTRYAGFFAHPHVVDHLAGYAIPEDEVENYNDAIDAGRAVVLYRAKSEEAPKVEQAFKSAGLKHVKSFYDKVGRSIG